MALVQRVYRLTSLLNKEQISHKKCITATTGVRIDFLSKKTQQNQKKTVGSNIVKTSAVTNQIIMTHSTLKMFFLFSTTPEIIKIKICSLMFLKSSKSSK